MYEVTRYKEYYKMNKGNCEGTYEMTCNDREDSAKAAKRMRYVNRLVNEKERAEQERLERNGLCPHCHIYLPDSGECDICGYTKPQPTGNITPSFYERLAKVKGGFAE